MMFDRISSLFTGLLLLLIMLPVLGLGLVPGTALPIYLVNLAGQVMCFAGCPWQWT